MRAPGGSSSPSPVSTPRHVQNATLGNEFAPERLHQPGTAHRTATGGPVVRVQVQHPPKPTARAVKIIWLVLRALTRRHRPGLARPRRFDMKCHEQNGDLAAGSPGRTFMSVDATWISDGRVKISNSRPTIFTMVLGTTGFVPCLQFRCLPAAKPRAWVICRAGDWRCRR
jgi:hypothetical protein